MKTKHKIILISAGFGLLFYAIDAVLDSLFFYEGTFMEMLITDVPGHELYIRLAVVAFFVAFGIFVLKVLAGHKETEKRIGSLNKLKENVLSPGTLSEKLRRITDAVVTVFDADFVRIWIVKPGDMCDSGCMYAGVTEGSRVCRYRDRCLHLMASSGRYTHTDGKVHRRVPFDCYKIGRVAAGDDPKFITNDVTRDPRVHNHDWARKLGLVSFAGYRLLSPDRKPIGVLALFSKNVISAEDDILLEGFANTTAQVIRTTQTEQALEKNNQFLQDIFDGIQDGISVLDSDLNIVKVNPWMEKMYADAMPLLKRKCYEVYQKRQTPCPWCPSVMAIETGREHSAIVPYPSEENPTGWIDLSAFPLKDTDGRVTGIIECVRDITDRRKTEQTLERVNKRLHTLVERLTFSNRELQEFAYMVAHDLKTPLRGIVTLADWLSTDYAGKFDQKGHEQIELLKTRVKRMMNMIDAISKYSEIGSVKRREKIDLNALLSEIIVEIDPPQNIFITVESELPVIECDKSRITLVFHNLLSNAVKYMNKPKGQIKIACVEENGFWKFSVTDNGPGIEERHFEKVFKMFHTLSPRDEIEGTGIGLSLAEKIVETYGGTIWVESKPTQGSTFYFTLPKDSTNLPQNPAEIEMDTSPTG